MGHSTPRYGVRQTVNIMAKSNKAATTIMGSIKFFTNVLVREVRAVPIDAGTASDTSAFNIFKNTTSIGAVVFGKVAPGTAVDASLTDTTFAATDTLAFKNTNNDATALVNLLVDYNEEYVYTQ